MAHLVLAELSSPRGTVNTDGCAGALSTLWSACQKSAYTLRGCCLLTLTCVKAKTVLGMPGLKDIENVRLFNSKQNKKKMMVLDLTQAKGLKDKVLKNVRPQLCEHPGTQS